MLAGAPGASQFLASGPEHLRVGTGGDKAWATAARITIYSVGKPKPAERRERGRVRIYRHTKTQKEMHQPHSWRRTGVQKERIHSQQGVQALCKCRGQLTCCRNVLALVNTDLETDWWLVSPCQYLVVLMNSNGRLSCV